MKRPRASVMGSILLLGVTTALATPVVVQLIWALSLAEGRDALRELALDGVLVARTLAVTLIIGTGATILAWPTAWWARSQRARFRSLLILPMVLPSYFLTSSYNLLRAPGTIAGDLLLQSSPSTIRFVVVTQVMIGMVLWSWPIATLILWVAIGLVPRDQIEALRLLSSGGTHNALHRVRLLSAGIFTSILVVALVMAGSAVPFHIANLPTYAIEVWRTLNENASTAPAWGMSAPLVVCVALASTILVSRTRVRQLGTNTFHSESGHRLGQISTGATWSLAVLVPVCALMISLNIGSDSLRSIFRMSTPAVLASALNSAIVFFVVLSLGLTASLGMTSRWGALGPRVVRHSLCVLVALMLVPGVLVGSSILELSLVHPSFGWVAGTQSGVTIAHTTRFVALVVACVVCARAWEPTAFTHLRRSEPDTLVAWAGSTLRLDIPLLLGGGVLVAMLSFHEIESAVTLTQPGGDNLPRHMLNMLHYNRVQELNVLLLAMLVVGTIVTLAVALIARRSLTERTTTAVLLALPILGVLSSCSRSPADADDSMSIVAIHGEPGRSPGQFIKPRAIDADQESIWVIDRSGRVQRLNAAGEQLLEWELPDHEKGFPTGITVGSDGRVYIADTHEHRVLVCRVEGDTLTIENTVGSYGRGDGQFIYPTDVAIQTAPDGVTPTRYFVSEYGGNDRVSVFDAQWRFLLSFGREGYSGGPDDIAFCRPQSLLFDNSRAELLVADACNHRIGRFTTDGDLVEWYENDARDTPFRYPYGLTLAPGSSVLVTEFGHNRIQRIDWDTGRTVAQHGRPGRDENGLIEPWSCAILGGLVYVLDTGKHRIVSFELPPHQEETPR